MSEHHPHNHKRQQCYPTHALCTYQQSGLLEVDSPLFQTLVNDRLAQRYPSPPLHIPTGDIQKLFLDLVLKTHPSPRRGRTVKGSVWFLYLLWTFGNSAPDDGRAVSSMVSPLKASAHLYHDQRSRYQRTEILSTLDVPQDGIDGLRDRWTFRAGLRATRESRGGFLSRLGVSCDATRATGAWRASHRRVANIYTPPQEANETSTCTVTAR